jgi:SAM-dependent methyltransferase
MKYELPVKSAYSLSLPPSYFETMRAVMEGYCADWLTDQMRADGYAEYFIQCYVYGRLDQCRDSVVPWLRANIPTLQKHRVLEIGAGTGSSTAGLAPFVHSIFGFDIEQRPLDVARARCDALGIQNVDLRLYPTNWIEKFHADPTGYFGQHFDLAFCYALFEHLTIVERVKLLQALWKHLPRGGLLVTIELPNRLHWYDWHSSQLPFADMLPPDLSALYYGKSERSSIGQSLKASTPDEIGALNMDEIYRLGKGISYHEFAIALPEGSYRVVAGNKSPNAINRTNLPGYDADWEDMLAKKLTSLDPPVDPAFAACCLDLIVEKVL